MPGFAEAGVCDCHSHVFGPFSSFPLSPSRTFDPPQSPLPDLLPVWDSLGIERAVLVQGSAHGMDPSALLEAVMLSPATRRGVVLLHDDTSDERLEFLNERGVRAVRFNWVRHLSGGDGRTHSERLASAGRLLSRVGWLGWHVELHIDMESLHLAKELETPEGMPIVIDHMARIDMCDVDAEASVEKLVLLLERRRFWVKLSGADRLAAASEELPVALSAMRAFLHCAPDRCVWGLDWPHVNLARRRTDAELFGLIQEAAGTPAALRKVLVTNPATLYGFEEQ